MKKISVHILKSYKLFYTPKSEFKKNVLTSKLPIISFQFSLDRTKKKIIDLAISRVLSSVAMFSFFVFNTIFMVL